MNFIKSSIPSLLASILLVTTSTSFAGSFPLKYSERDRVGSGQFVQCNVTVSKSGRVDGVVKLKNVRTLDGFKGGCVVLLGDKSGNILWGSRVHKTGVNACAFSCPNNKKSSWSEMVSPNITKLVKTIRIVNQKTPDDNLWKERIKDAIAIAKNIKNM